MSTRIEGGKSIKCVRIEVQLLIQFHTLLKGSLTFLMNSPIRKYVIAT